MKCNLVQVKELWILKNLSIIFFLQNSLNVSCSDKAGAGVSENPHR